MRNVLMDAGVRGQSVYHQGARGGISPSAYIYESDSNPRNHCDGSFCFVLSRLACLRVKAISIRGHVPFPLLLPPLFPSPSPPPSPPSTLGPRQGDSLHSQAITEFCTFVGAQGKTRNRLIKKAKTNGDELGFLW